MSRKTAPHTPRAAHRAHRARCGLRVHHETPHRAHRAKRNTAPTPHRTAPHRAHRTAPCRSSVLMKHRTAPNYTHVELTRTTGAVQRAVLDNERIAWSAWKTEVVLATVTDLERCKYPQNAYKWSEITLLTIGCHERPHRTHRAHRAHRARCADRQHHETPHRANRNTTPQPA